MYKEQIDGAPIENGNHDVDTTTSLSEEINLHDVGSMCEISNEEENGICSPEPVQVSFEGSSAKPYQPWTDTIDGKLFLKCIRCNSMIMIQFKEGFVPPLTIAGGYQCDNAIVMTGCATCEERIKLENNGVAPSLDEMITAFKMLRLSPLLVQSSDMMRVAKLIVHKNVDPITHKTFIAYMDRRNITKLTKRDDVLLSLDISRVETGDKHEIVLPYLQGGFF